MANSKVVLSNGTVLIDLTADTVAANNLLSGYTAHGADGEAITGACTFDSDTSEDTAGVSEVLSGKTFHARGTGYTGMMTNNGAVDGKITSKSTPYVVPQGYHDGSGTVSLDSVSAGLLIPQNIRENIEILGVTGTMSGSEDVHAQAKSTTPSFAQQVITPDTGYTHLSQVTVSAIPVAYTDNPAGGKTVTIG